MPAIDFIPEMMELCPEAKAVPVRRNPGRWAKSIDVMTELTEHWSLPYVMWLIPGWSWYPWFVHEFEMSTKRYRRPDW